MKTYCYTFRLSSDSGIHSDSDQFLYHTHCCFYIFHTGFCSQCRSSDRYTLKLKKMLLLSIDKSCPINYVVSILMKCRKFAFISICWYRYDKTQMHTGICTKHYKNMCRYRIGVISLLWNTMIINNLFWIF